MRGFTKKTLAGVMTVAFVCAGVLVADQAQAGKKTAAELDAAKKEGDLSVEEAKKFRDAFGREADEANIESFETKTNKKGSSTSTYGVVGFDYLTGVGKVASSPDKIDEKTFKIKSNINSPLEGLMKKRFDNKWTGQYNDTESGWTEKSGVTEVWFRGVSKDSNLGGDYNEWVNQWNNITRPRHDNKTPVAGTDPDQGAHWFSFYCVHCHGWSGKGDGPTAATLDPRPRNLTNGKYANYISNLDLFAVIKGGGPARNLSEAMPPWGNILQDQDIWNIISFLRTLPEKPKYEADAGEVTAANAAKSQEFKDMNEELELEGVMAGRGGGLTGGYDSIGGGRLSSKTVGVSTHTTSDTGAFKAGDWALDKK
ncbi:MAG: cytochrome c [Nitrospinae bacterium]|nr:cytochrome c [Nitrospinota bacterium]